MELIVDNVHSAQTYLNNMEHSTVASTLDFLDLLQHQLGQSEDFFMLLNIMQGMSSPGVDINRSIAQIVRLLQPFPDLLEGFNGFLPKVYSLPFPCAKQSASPQPTLPFTHSSSLSSSLHAPMDFIQHSPDRSSLIYSSSPPTLSRACSPEPTSSSLKMTKQENASNDIAGCLISAFSVLEPSKAGTSSSSTPSAPDDFTCLTSVTDSQIGQQACPTSPTGNRTPPQLSPEASPTSTVSTGTLPLCVEREHAMQFIEEIEATYHDRPELYQSFLNLLRTYQLKHMGIEGEVLKEADEETFCQELVNLFSQDHNLLNTFMSLLPSTLRGQLDSKVHICSYNKNYKRTLDKTQSEAVAVGENLDLPPLKKNKRLSSFRDASLAAAGQYGTLRELSFFDKVRRALRSQEVYENFLRCIHLYNIDIISVSDLLDLIKPFLGKFPELLIQFKHLLGKCFGMSTQRDSLQDRVENIEMDLSSCKRLGPSYRALPESYQQPKCSGRTALCREVLNDIWVSFPSWSEDSTFVSSKKTQYEEHIYRCEDERFELDVVLETNLATIRVLENVQKKLSRLSPEEQSHLHLDDCLGGTSEVINCKALQRIYGDKAAEVIAGLKQNPANSIPVVLKRLKAREEEWREAQKGFNKLWREQNDRFYLRSLDPCGLTFRQLDTKALRSKSLLNQIEEAFDERQELMTTGQVQAFSSPHISLDYPDHTLHTDATALLLHDLGSHTGPATAELQHTRDLLFVFLPMLLFAPQLHPEDFVLDKSSGNEDESVSEEKEDHSLGSPCEQKNAIQKTFAQACNPGAADSVYSLFFANSTWYIFLRLHQILCTRLLYIREHAPESVPAKNQASLAQGGNPQAETAISPADTTEEKVDSVEPEKEAKGGSGYAAFLALTRRLLDGEMEPSEYEDALRDLLTIHGFVAYTMDRLVHHACRQLQQLVCDEACISLVKLHREARARGAGGGLCVSHAVRAPLEACYHRQAEQIVADDNCFKVMFIQSGEHVVMTMELLDSEEESTEDTFEIENWSNYVEHYTNSEDVGVEIHLSQKPIFLRRNLQRQQAMENMIAQWYRSKQHKSKLKVVEDLEYRFRFNSFQLQFVANSEDYFYRRGSLHRARQHRFGAKRLQAWHCWLAERARKGGLLKEQDRATRMWFMGLNQESSTIMAVCLQIMANGRSVNVYRSVMCTSRLPDSP